MSKGTIVSLHSYRGGTGKSNLTACIAYCLGKIGKTVAVVDTDLAAPGVHIVLGLKDGRIVRTLSDFLFKGCRIEEVAYDVSHSLGLDGECGRLYLLPAELTLEGILRFQKDYDVNKLNEALDRLIESLNLDFLFIDTHPGLNRETLLTTAISDILVLVLRPDQQDYHGTKVLAEVARKSRVPNVLIVANKVSNQLDKDSLREKLNDVFGFSVIGVLPLFDEVAALGSLDVFARRFPSHPFSGEVESIAKRIATIADCGSDGSTKPG